jgi:hypothetical protein
LVVGRNGPIESHDGLGKFDAEQRITDLAWKKRIVAVVGEIQGEVVVPVVVGVQAVADVV